MTKINDLITEMEGCKLKWDLRPLLTKNITITNFSDIFNLINDSKKREMLLVISKHPEHKKWLIGKENFPLRVFLESCSPAKYLLSILKQAKLTTRTGWPKSEVKLPFKLNEDLAYFLGVIAGDGHIGNPKQNQKTSWYIGMYEDNFDYQVKIYSPIVKRLFDYNLKFYINKRKDGRRNLFSQVNSMIVVIYLTKILRIERGPKATTVGVPNFIYKNKDLNLRFAFVRGLFDTDGTVVDKKARFSTTSKKLVTQVKKILNKAHIHSHITKWLKNERSSLLYTLVIQKRSLRDFKNLIGFNNIKKKNKLESLLAPSSSG